MSYRLRPRGSLGRLRVAPSKAATTRARRATPSTDCPFGYTCLLARPGGAATCEVLSPNLQILPPTGPVVSSDSYCTDVEPLLQRVLHLCHVVPIPPEPPLIPVWFTLDAYGDDVDAGPQPDGGYILGAYTMAALSAQYVTNGLMPLSPSSVPVPLTAAQQKIFADWAAGGAPCAYDGGSHEKLAGRWG